MTIIDIEKDQEAADFALKAAEHFRDNDNCFTYAKNDPQAGKLLALRWTPYTVAVVRLAEDELIRLYGSQQLIKQDFPKLQPKW